MMSHFITLIKHINIRGWGGVIENRGNGTGCERERGRQAKEPRPPCAIYSILTYFLLLSFYP